MDPSKIRKVGADAGLRELVERLKNLEIKQTTTTAGLSVVREAADQTYVRQRTREAIEAAENLQTDLSAAQAEIDAAQAELDEAKANITQALADSEQARLDAEAAHGEASQASLDASEAWNKAVAAEQAAALNSLVLEVESTEGTVFKSGVISSILISHVYKGGVELTHAEIMELGTVRWYRDGQTTPVGSGPILEVNEGATDKARFIAQLENP